MLSTLSQKATFFISSSPMLLSPANRMQMDTIHSNIHKKIDTKKMFNNFTIGLNCTNIALKYSKCYLCKLPPVNYTIRKFNNMEFVDNNIEKINYQLFKDFPKEIKLIRTLGKYFKYQNKNLYSSISLLFTENITADQQLATTKFLTAIQAITLGFQLHHNVGTDYRPNTVVEIGLKIIQKVIKDKYLVLAGDYFHIKASVMGGQSQLIQISKILAQMQINLCKYVHYKQQLKAKIQSQGYKKVTIDQIYNISKMQAKQITQGIMGMDIITQKDLKKQEKLYNCIGLLVLYRKQLENFMFNFYKILVKYLEYTKNLKMSFCDEYTLTNYIFYQSAQKNQRIDIAYLNTVQMMSEQIKYIENQIQEILSTQQNERIKSKINYLLNIHSS